MIYVVQAISGGPVKIGVSQNVPARLKQLEAHYGQPLALLATLEGGREEEQAIHERFAEHRLGRTEQFRPVAEIMAFIGRPLLVSPNPDAAEDMEPAEREGVRHESFRLRMSGEFKAWLERYAAYRQLSAADTVAHSIMAAAKADGFEPPPRR